MGPDAATRALPVDGAGGLPPVLGGPAPALAGQPLHLRRRAVAGGLLPLRLGRQRVRLLGGHRPRRELHRLPVVEHPEDRRPAARARAASCRSTGSSGRRPSTATRTSSTATSRAARRSSPPSPRAAPHRTGCGGGSPRTPSSRRSRSRTTPARRWCTTTGTTTTPASAGWSRCSRPAAGNYESETCFRQYSDGTADRHVHARRAAPGAPFRPHRVLRPRPRRELRRGARPVADRGLTIFEALWSRRTCAATTRGVLAVLRLGPAPDGQRARVGRCPAADACTPAATPSSPGSTSCGTARIVHMLRGEPGLPPGHRRVDLRVEWGQADTTTRWDGRLTVDGGRLVLPDHVGPEVVAMDSHGRGSGSTSRTASASPTGRSAVASRSASAGRRRAGDRRLRGPDRSGSGWPSWPNGWPAARSCPTASRVGPGRLWRCSPPSAPCSASACGRVDVSFRDDEPLREPPSTTRGCSRWTASWPGRRRSGCGRQSGAVRLAVVSADPVADPRGAAQEIVDGPTAAARRSASAVPRRGAMSASTFVRLMLIPAAAASAAAATSARRAPLATSAIRSHSPTSSAPTVISSAGGPAAARRASAIAAARCPRSASLDRGSA